MGYVWFWTFWHWSKEGWRAGTLLDGPVHGMAGHWDEWYRHEASPGERAAIAEAGRTPASQRRFVAWLARRWAADARWCGAHPPARVVLSQLAVLAPFDEWAAFARYRDRWHVPGIAAVVLGEASAGTADDVRTVEAICVPAESDAGTPPVVAQGFHVDPAELAAARDAVASLLGGRGTARLLALWVAAGQRPWPRPVAIALAAGWVAAAVLVAWLLVGPDPGGALPALAGALLALWGTLAATAVLTAAVVAAGAWRAGRRVRARVLRGQLRLRMEGGLTLIGGSAGLPIALNMLLAALRVRERGDAGAWLWRRIARALRAAAPAWAATGVVTADGRVHPVVLAPKLRAVLRHARVAHLLAPAQREASPRAVAQARLSTRPATPAAGAEVRLGFAAAMGALASHRARHLAHATLAAAGLRSRWQAATGALALVASALVLPALPDLRAIVRPPRAPEIVAPTSQAPHQLWLSLETRHPRDFVVTFESGFWSNRRVPVVGGDLAGRGHAAIPLARRRAVLPVDVTDGTLWVERRPRFLWRTFAPGARVGRYSLSYVSRLHD